MSAMPHETQYPNLYCCQYHKGATIPNYRESSSNYHDGVSLPDRYSHRIPLHMKLANIVWQELRIVDNEIWLVWQPPGWTRN
jgi:hypothetical protein